MLRVVLLTLESSPVWKKTYIVNIMYIEYRPVAFTSFINILLQVTKNFYRRLRFYKHDF